MELNDLFIVVNDKLKIGICSNSYCIPYFIVIKNNKIARIRFDKPKYFKSGTEYGNIKQYCIKYLGYCDIFETTLKNFKLSKNDKKILQYLMRKNFKRLLYVYNNLLELSHLNRHKYKIKKLQNYLNLC